VVLCSPHQRGISSCGSDRALGLLGVEPAYKRGSNDAKRQHELKDGSAFAAIVHTECLGEVKRDDDCDDAATNALQQASAKQGIKKLLEDDKFEGKDGRQVAIVDAKGNVATYTGPNAPKWAGDRQGKNWSAQGNILVGPQVPEAMGKAFEETSGELAEKLFAALKAGDAAGGDSRGRQSASMLVVRKVGGRNINNDRYIYINVDDNPDPFKELRRLLDLNLSYNYGDQMYKAFAANDLPKARAAAQKALTYSPSNANTHMQLGFLNYALGDKAVALNEFSQARTLRPDDFVKRWQAEVESPQFKSMKEDQEFLKKLFPPDGVPPATTEKGSN
jgi:uncharacterized Ntn-hydrolase superfamily protein